MREEESYKKIVEMLSNGNFLQLNGKTINLTELNEYINAQQEEIERLNNIINELEECIESAYNWEGVSFDIKVNGEWTTTENMEEVRKYIQELKGSDKE